MGSPTVSGGNTATGSKWYYTPTTQAQLAKPVRAFFGYTNFPAAYAVTKWLSVM
jgi:hypothetical protein